MTFPKSARRVHETGLRLGAFTLLEIIVACAIFFIVAFAVLGVVAQGLAGAKALQKRDPDPGIILHSLALSNTFEEGTLSGDYEDIAPRMYAGHRWEANITEIGSNGLFQVDVFTYDSKNPRQSPVKISTQFWRPASKPGSASKPKL